MPGTDDLAAATATAVPEPAAPTPPRVRAAAFGVLFAGVLASVVVIAFLRAFVDTAPLYTGQQIWPVVFLLVGAAIAEIVYVPVPAGDEELTYYEVVLLIAVVVFPPAIAVIVPLLGFMLTEPLLRVSPVKAIFNVGSYALAGSALVAVYAVISRDTPLFGFASVAGLVLGSLAFATVNLAALSFILRVAEGVAPLRFVREQWTVSAIMAVGSVAVAATAVALALHAPLLTPFALMPAAALWYAYQSSAQHAAAQERNRWMLALNTSLAQPRSAGDLVPRAGNALRRVFRADYVRVLTSYTEFAGDPIRARPLSPLDRVLLETAPREPTPIPVQDLPDGWASGYVVRIDLADGPGALVLGGRPSARANRLLPWATGVWHMEDVDLPVLASLAASFASAVRAGQHFAALREETAKLSAVVDHASDGIAVFDRAGGVVLWSPAMTTITGLSAAAAQSAGGEDSDVVSVLGWLAGTETDAIGESVTITRPDGEARDLSVAVVGLGDEAGMRVMTVRDITQQRRVERMKADFIATVSHELRTPITPIKGYAQLLSDRWERINESKRTDILATIVDRADHLSRLVDDLLLASRVSDTQTAKLDVTMTEVDLAELVAETVSAFPELHDRITVTGSSATVRCDRVRAIQCLSNLIGNAAKYSAPETPIRVESAPPQGGRWATVDVVDRGRGIPAEELDKVFERFYRVEDPMTMTTGGSGLGLFISRELARAMDGDITVTSTYGQGSTFRLLLPVSGQEAA